MREQLDNRWSHQWSSYSTNSLKAQNRTRRVLYLWYTISLASGEYLVLQLQFSRSGYDHTQAQKKTQHTPIPFTSCLAHAEVTYVEDSEKILCIWGFFHHNEACIKAEFTRILPVPVHPSVYVVVLSQLRDGATFVDVKKKNRELVTARSYKDFPAGAQTSPYCWLLEPRDSQSLYRQYNHMNGVKVTEKAHVNVDEWLDPASP
jgi:hypothetical protein